MLKHNSRCGGRGLSNGAQGTVATISETRGTTPGSHLRPLKGSQDQHQGRAERREIDGKMVVVRIDPTDRNLLTSKGQQMKRTQLPVILSFAMTIHKV